MRNRDYRIAIVGGIVLIGALLLLRLERRDSYKVEPREGSVIIKIERPDFTCVVEDYNRDGRFGDNEIHIDGNLYPPESCRTALEKWEDEINRAQKEYHNGFHMKIFEYR